MLKRLAVIAIVLTFPVLVASIYGMNVPLPYQDSPNAFFSTPPLAGLVISVIIGRFFLKKRIF